jgi:hypothetical protein
MSQTKENENPIVFLRKVYMDIILNEIEESRIAHRLGGDTNIAEPEEASTLSIAAPVSAERIEKLELAVESLQIIFVRFIVFWVIKIRVIVRNMLQ